MVKIQHTGAQCTEGLCSQHAAQSTWVTLDAPAKACLIDEGDESGQGSFPFVWRCLREDWVAGSGRGQAELAVFGAHYGAHVSMNGALTEQVLNCFCLSAVNTVCVGLSHEAVASVCREDTTNPDVQE